MRPFDFFYIFFSKAAFQNKGEENCIEEVNRIYKSDTAEEIALCSLANTKCIHRKAHF